MDADGSLSWIYPFLTLLALGSIAVGA